MNQQGKPKCIDCQLYAERSSQGCWLGPKWYMSDLNSIECVL